MIFEPLIITQMPEVIEDKDEYHEAIRQPHSLPEDILMVEDCRNLISQHVRIHGLQIPKVNEKVLELLQQRREAKASKDYKLADEIRSTILVEYNYHIVDLKTEAQKLIAAD